MSSNDRNENATHTRHRRNVPRASYNLKERFDEIMKEEPDGEKQPRPKKRAKKNSQATPSKDPAAVAPEGSSPMPPQPPPATSTSSQTIVEERPEQLPRITALEFATTNQREYAGYQTEELEIRYKHFQESVAQVNNPPTAGDAAHDMLCLVCYDNLDYGTPLKLCVTCPRVFHTSCLKPEALPNVENAHNRSQYCPLCVKRTWDIRAPTNEERTATIFEAEKTRSILTRAYLNNPNMRRWIGLYDDGSLESDHRLIKDMGMVDLAKWVDTEEEL